MYSQLLCGRDKSTGKWAWRVVIGLGCALLRLYAQVFFLVRRPCTPIDEKTNQDVLRAHELKLVIVY